MASEKIYLSQIHKIEHGAMPMGAPIYDATIGTGKECDVFESFYQGMSNATTTYAVVRNIITHSSYTPPFSKPTL